jgi:hypothetical protein
MTRWSNADLLKIVEADDLKISPLREDGKTHGTPTWIWCVAVEGELFVRGYHGQASRWYQAAVAQQAGQIIAAGTTSNVVFEPVSDGALNDAIDNAYRTKYATSPYLKAMVAASARSATIRIAPRER